MSHQNLKLGQSVQKRRQELGETQESLAEAIDLSQSFIGKLERGAADVSAMKVKNFVALLERLRWSAADFAEETGMELSPLIRPAAGGGGKGKKNVSMPSLVRAEVYAPATAGRPSLEGAEHRTHTYLHGRDLKEGLEFYVAEGDSMTTADPNSIYDGDILHVNAFDRTLIPGRVFLFHIPGDGLTVKRTRNIGGELWLMSDNPSHDPFRPSEVEVLGRVVSWTRTIRP